MAANSLDNLVKEVEEQFLSFIPRKDPAPDSEIESDPGSEISSPTSGCLELEGRGERDASTHLSEKTAQEGPHSDRVDGESSQFAAISSADRDFLNQRKSRLKECLYPSSPSNDDDDDEEEDTQSQEGNDNHKAALRTEHVYSSSPIEDDDDRPRAVQEASHDNMLESGLPPQVFDVINESLIRAKERITKENREKEEEEEEKKQQKDEGNDDDFFPFAPCDAFFTGQMDHLNALLDLERLRITNTGPNGPHGPNRSVYETDHQTSVLLRRFDELKKAHGINTILAYVVTYLIGGGEEEDGDVHKEVHGALDLARKFDDEPAIAKFYLWLGILEYKDTGARRKAYEHLKNARFHANKCPIGEYSVESELLDYLLSLFTRSSVPSRNAVAGNINPRSLGNLKRKGHNGERFYRRRNCRQPHMRGISIPAVWIERDTLDSKFHSPSEQPASPATKDHQKTKHRLPKVTFSFRKHPRDLMARARKENVSSEQP